MIIDQYTVDCRTGQTTREQREHPRVGTAQECEAREAAASQAAQAREQRQQVWRSHLQAAHGQGRPIPARELAEMLAEVLGLELEGGA